MDSDRELRDSDNDLYTGKLSPVTSVLKLAKRFTIEWARPRLA